MSEYIQNMFGYDGQTVVVIGGAGELGGALCRAFAQAGANVVVADVTEAGCKKRVAELESLGGKAFWTLIDVTKRESIVNALDEAKKSTSWSTRRASTSRPRLFWNTRKKNGISLSIST